MGNSIHRFMIGKMECIALLDKIEEDPVNILMANVDLGPIDQALSKYGLKKDGKFTYPYTCLLINMGSQRVLVDTGMGDLWTPGGMLLDCLQKAGVEPKDINVVILSHAHGDHIGGNTDNDGRIIFPNAQWVMAKKEWEFWTNLENLKDLPPFFAEVIKRKLLILSDRVRLVDGETEILPGIITIPLAGHTPGHLVIAVRSQGQELLYTADAMLHPVHLEHPDWCASHWADLDWEGVTRSRLELYARATSKHSLVLAFHFTPFPSLGYIEQAGKVWCWVPWEKD